MRYVLALLVVAILAVPHKSARAQEARCQFVEQGHAYVKMSGAGATWAYVVRVTGPNWRQASVGWHAPGFLICQSCQSDGLYQFGYFMFAIRQNNTRPPTAAARVQSAEETFGYPHRRLTKEQLEYQASREPISIGSLTGYAVRYKGWLVVSVTGDCIVFETTLRTPPDDDWRVLDSFLTEISIEKKAGAEVRPRAGSIVTRPRREGEEPVRLHEQKPSPPEQK